MYADGRFVRSVERQKNTNKMKEFEMKKLIAVVGVSLIAAVAMVFSASAADSPDAGKKHGPRVMGTITAISADSITVDSKKDGEVKIAMDKNTVFGSKDEPKKCDDFKVGDKVVVAYTEDGDKKCATRVGTPKPHAKK